MAHLDKDESVLLALFFALSRSPDSGRLARLRLQTHTPFGDDFLISARLLFQRGGRAELVREITDALYREFLIFVGADVVELLGGASCNLDKVVAIGGDRDGQVANFL